MSDDLVKKLRSQIGDDIQEFYSHEALFRLAADRIEELETLIKELFRLLDITEQTDEGRLFRPNRIYSCRVVDGEKLNIILAELKQMTKGK